MHYPVVVSYFQTRPLLRYRGGDARSVAVSPDLGLTAVEAVVELDGVRFPQGECLSWDAIEGINAAENNCFIVETDGIRKIAVFSEVTNRPCSLMPTSGAPTLLLSGIPMHRIKDTDPHKDTLEKIKSVQPVVGCVLDTATGLGYTAIEAAKTADAVVTVEVDPGSLAIARMNPWSRDLFENPKITQRVGDSYDVVEALPDASFTRVIHDPPMFKFAGHLYSRDFYEELYRVLRRGGRVFHYVGDPESRSGRSTTRGVMKRLEEAGFSRVVARPRAFGVVAVK
jgi:predicted methyltransferase